MMIPRKHEMSIIENNKHKSAHSIAHAVLTNSVLFMFWSMVIIAIYMLLCSCSHNIDNVESEQQQGVHIVYLNVKVDGAIVKNDNKESTRAFAYDFNNKQALPLLRLKADDVEEGLCLIRNENPKIPLRCIKVVWKGGENGVRCDNFTADIKCPNNEKIGKWEACFLLGQGKYDEKSRCVIFSGEHFARPITIRKEQRWDMPYLSKWLPLSTEDGVNMSTPRVNFLPQGSFIRMKIANNTEKDINIAALRMKPTDNSMQAAPFVWEAKWQVDEQKDSPIVVPVLLKNGEDLICKLDKPITLKPKEMSKVYGFWVMPVGKNVSFSNDLYIVPQTEAIAKRSEWWLYHTPLDGMSNSQGQEAGKSYTFKPKLRSIVPTKLNNWMQDMEDDRLICKMSIPGTHDTGAWSGIWWVKTQDKDIKGQLENGIRFFDIRLVLDGDVLKLCHSSIVFDRTFHKDVLRATADFLRDHPSETVIMTIKRDCKKYDDGGNRYRTAVGNILNADPYIKQYIAGAFSPDLTMGDIRGKMLIVSREGWYSTNSGWITSWPDNRQFSTTLASTNYSTTTLHVEDTYKCRAGDKVNLVRQNLIKASDAYGGMAPEWFITFCSYTGPNGIGTPNAVTGYVDPYVKDFLTKDQRLRTTGILLFNFEGWYGLTKEVINFNKIFPPKLIQRYEEE